jgi:prepilin signal peptidase PulO-like enzyme (type II secretory pathway)
MLLMVGAFLGFRDTILTMVIGSVLGSVVGFLYIRITRKELSTYELPFGTFLSIGGIAVTLLGPTVFQWYGKVAP